MSVRITADTVREWGRRYSNWGRWGSEDELGALNFITPGRVLAACSCASNAAAWSSVAEARRSGSRKAWLNVQRSGGR